MKRVCVMMSTYNGERYLRQQIDSILQLCDVEVALVVRDDGSTDSTPQILDEYQQNRQLEWRRGASNLGPARSFLKLLADAPTADYYAFSDQDDFWQTDKLSTAVSRLQTLGETALYASEKQPADEHLSPLPTVQRRYLQTFGESLIFRFVSGCTMVFTEKLRQTVLSVQPDFLPMHDAWIYNIAQAIDADFYYDYTPKILYRQHGDNVVGQTSRMEEWRRRWHRFRQGSGIRSTMARQLLAHFSSQMSNENMATLKLFVDGKKSFAARLKILRDSNLRCADRTTLALFRISVLLNKY